MGSRDSSRKVFIVDGVRTPFLKARGLPGAFKAADLACFASRALLNRRGLNPERLDEVVFGCVIPAPDEINIARIIALRMGCGYQVPAYTVQRNCASGMQAIDEAYKDIQLGRCDMVLAGGCEAMSHAPLLWPDSMLAWLGKWRRSASLAGKLKLLSQVRGHHIKPVVALLKGLKDPVVGLSMGQTAEKVAHKFSISRTSMDELAVESHRRLEAAINSGHFVEEIIPLIDPMGEVYREDDGLRRDASCEKLAKLRPVFEPPFGSVTAGNSSQISDGAAALLLASEEAVRRYNLPTMGVISEVAWAALDPSEMGLGPVHAIAKLLHAHHLSMDAIDIWEINEAFAAQVLACAAAFKDSSYCNSHALSMDASLGELDLEKVNMDGGAIALGHPIGATGARLVLHLMYALKRTNKKRGVASLCIGGGQGGALLLERL